MRSVLFRTVFLSAVLALFPLVAFSATENAQPGATQAGRSAAKAEYVPVKIGSETVNIKVPEDFVLAEGVENTKWYKSEYQLLTESRQIPLLLFVPPNELQKLKETSGYFPEIYFSVSVPESYEDFAMDVDMFWVFRLETRLRTNKNMDEPGDAPAIVTYVHEDDSLLAWVVTPDLSNPDLDSWWPTAEAYVLIGGRAVMCCFARKNSGPDDISYLKSLLLKYFDR